MLILHDLVCKHWAIIVLYLDGEVYFVNPGPGLSKDKRLRFKFLT